MCLLKFKSSIYKLTVRVTVTRIAGGVRLMNRVSVVVTVLNETEVVVTVDLGKLTVTRLVIT